MFLHPLGRRRDLPENEVVPAHPDSPAKEDDDLHKELLLYLKSAIPAKEDDAT